MSHTEVRAPFEVTCTRCGTFIGSVEDGRVIDAQTYCLACASRPDVDYLEAFRLKCWGKRDLWAWVFGIGVLSSTAKTAVSFMAGAFLEASFSVFSAVVGACFFLGQRWARLGVIWCLIGGTAIAMSRTSREEPNWVLVAAITFSWLVVLAILNDTRNRLFFRLEVSREKLQKAWEVHSNNVLARTGFLLSLFSVLAFPAAPVALLLCVVGLSRVNPAASPPIGRKKQAIAGIVISSFIVAGGVFLLTQS